MRSIFITILLFVSATSHAAIVQWTFQDVVFDDGATLSGSFIWDQYGESNNSNIIYDINLSMTGGNLSDTIYNYYESAGGNEEVTILRFIESSPAPADLTGTRILELAFQDILSTAGTISLAPVVDVGAMVGAPPGALMWNNREAFCVTVNCTLFDPRGPGGRNLVSGSIVGAVVPIPAAVWLFGSGLGLLGWIRRRQS